jgi:L-threonylcarbamoyladenylate synthase
MKTEIIAADGAQAIDHALDVLNHGGLVAFPTDTVYGLAAPAFESAVVDRLYLAKGRSHEKAIAILLGHADELPRVADRPKPMALQLARHFWPGALTLIVPRHPLVPDAVSPLPTVGVRIPDHPVALALLAKTGPLAVTSANISGTDSPKTAQAVEAQMDGRVHLILDGGKTDGGVPSTVVDCTTEQPVILRPGPVTMKMLKKALKMA